MKPNKILFGLVIGTFFLLWVTAFMTVQKVSSTPQSESAIVSASSLATSNTTTATGSHLLLDLIDLSSFEGNTEQLPTADISLIVERDSNPLIVEDTKSLRFLVSHLSNEQIKAITMNNSHQFYTEAEAKEYLNIFPHDSSVISDELEQALNASNITWRAWFDIAEGEIPAYFFKLQLGRYVAEIMVIPSLDDNGFGHSLFLHNINKLFLKSQGINIRWFNHLPTILMNSDNTIADVQESTTPVRIVASRIIQEVIDWGKDQYTAEWNEPQNPQPDIPKFKNTCIPITGNNQCHADQNDFTFCFYSIIEGYKCRTDPWAYRGDAPVGRTQLDILTELMWFGVDSHIPQNYSASFNKDISLIISSPLTISPLNPNPNQVVLAQFKIKNLTNVPVHLEELTTAVRLGNDWGGEQFDFYSFRNITLNPNQEYFYISDRSFHKVGNYFAEPVVKIAGQWGGVAQANRVYFTVGNPPPGPSPTPPPTSQGITVLQVWPQNSVMSPNQSFNPFVEVQTTGFSLNCAQDFLENRDGNLYGTGPNQGCVSLGDNKYKFYFHTPMQTPGSSGEYHSQWKVWHYPEHIGPTIDISFRVGMPPNNNRPPSSTTLVSPHNWSEIRSVTPPQLCWNTASDPDGDTVEYYAEIFDSTVSANSGWTTGTCWQPSEITGQYHGYQWRVKTRDSSDAQSGWSERWHFSFKPPEYNPPIPTSTPLPLPTLPPTSSNNWWDTAYTHRRNIPIETLWSLPVGTLMKVDGLDLQELVNQGKVRSDFKDVRVVRRLSGNSWQEVARVVYATSDIEFQIIAPINVGINTSYYLYYGNPNPNEPVTFDMARGYWTDYYLDKWWSSYHSTREFNQSMDFENICEPPIDHDGQTGASLDQSDKYRGRIFIPTTGDWTFRVYTNDGYRLAIGDQEIARFDGYAQNRWETIGPVHLKSGWHVMRFQDMWVGCGAWKIAMEGPSFPNQIIPADYFQKLEGNLKTGITPGAEENQTMVLQEQSTNSTPVVSSTVKSTFSQKKSK